MKKLITIVGAGIICLSALAINRYKYYNKPFTVEYPGNFDGAIDSFNIHLNRDDFSTLLFISKNGRDAGRYFDVGNDGMVDYYSRIDYLREREIEKSKYEITDLDQEDYNIFLTEIANLINSRK